MWLSLSALETSKKCNFVLDIFQWFDEYCAHFSVSIPATLETQVSRHDELLSVHDIRLADMDLKLQVLETASFNGTLIWKIRDYKRRKQEAVASKTLSLYSQPFYTGYFGYKMCARVYLNGDGMGKGTHLSLFFVVMRGEYDALLPWPFRQKVTLMLMDQGPAHKHLGDAFKPDPNSSSFRRPTGEMNIASGCPLFVAQTVLENGTYIKDDTIFIKVTVDTSDLPDPWHLDSYPIGQYHCHFHVTETQSAKYFK